MFKSRQSLISATLEGSSCINSYTETYDSPLAIKFDPISRQIRPRRMCQEIVKELNKLIELDEATEANALRYSYLLSQTVDIETQQVDAYSTCTEGEARADPMSVCTTAISAPGAFELYTQE